MGQKANLTSVPTLVESPFIIVTIGGVTFGSYGASGNSDELRVTYPNFMKSLQVEKVNGTVNTYSIELSYQVAFGEDPNLLDKILSRATNDRRISIQYGDWNSPSYIYKEDVAIITNVTCNLDMSSSVINYVIKCTSDAIGLTSLSYNFPAREAKPSEVILEMLYNPRYGFQSVFKGMQNKSEVISKGLIASNDKKVKLQSQRCSPISYLNYLTNSMVSSKSTSSNMVSNSSYYLSVHDDVDNDMGGMYFKVVEVSSDSQSYVSADTYEVDINYPDDNFVTQFSLNNDQSWAILYDYAQDVKQEEYIYKINDNGELESEYAPTLVRSKKNNQTSPTKGSWWSKMTQFPITATLTIKGVIRPSILMTYVKVNVWFTGGQKHISSGLYVITKQVDRVDSSGYKTTLTLLRVGEDT